MWIFKFLLIFYVNSTMFLPFRLFKKELQRVDCFREYLNYVKSLKKHDNCALRISFLEQCRDSEITPKFLKFRIPNNGVFDDSSVHNFQRGLLHKEIGKARTALTQCITRLDQSRHCITQKLPSRCVPSAVIYSRIDRVAHRKATSATHEKKLKNLSLLQEKPLFNVENTVKVIDVSVHIPKYVFQTLAMGPRNPVMTEFCEKEVLSELDCFLKFCKDNYISDSSINDINIKTLHYIKTCKKQKSPRHFILTQKFLKNHDLVAVPFDKGIGFCVMHRQNYNSKLDPIIDLPQFIKVEEKRKNAKHPILKEEDRVVSVLMDLKKKGKISEELLSELRPTGSQPPRLYGLAKVHKDGTPLRPIVSMPGSAYQRVAKKIAAWLSLVPECRINTSTEKVAKQIQNMQLPPDECLVSFDIVSLYTNVPVKESIKVCADLLFKKVPMKSVDKETFITLAELACCNVVFSTHRGFYTQKDGLAMGSPPAPMLANGWLSQFENLIKDKSKMCERYMDDILCDIKKDDISDRLTLINNLHPKLEFTIETENDGKLAFLDMLIMNDSGILTSKWYRKVTDTGLTLNYHSLAPVKYKRSVVSSFVYRIFKSCSNWQLFHEGIQEAMTILSNNQYPESFIYPILNSTISKLVHNDNLDTSINAVDDIDTVSLDSNACLDIIADKDKFLFFINYRGKATDKLAHSYKKLNAPCKVIMTTRKIKTCLPSLKPSVPRMLLSNVVYQLVCSGCESSYVGQTVRHIQSRVREHLGSRGTMKAHFEKCGVCPSTFSENAPCPFNFLFG